MASMMTRWGVAMVACVLLAGCSGVAPGGMTLPGDDETPAQAIEGIQPCDIQIEGAIEETIRRQVDAFGQGDFAGAYAMAAPEFQSSITLVEFERLIKNGFQPLLNVSTFSVSQCLYDQALERAEISMTLVTSTDVVGTLRYLLVLGSEGWRILAAVPSNQESLGT
jgi:hypothetical protein